MDAQQFDRLARILASASRRRMLGAVLGTTVMGHGHHVEASEKGKKRQKCERKCRTRCQQQSTHGQCDALCQQACTSGKMRPLDCPNGDIECHRPEGPHACVFWGLLVNEGHGRCYSFPCCAPCGHLDQDYWNQRCNEAFATTGLVAIDTNDSACWNTC